MKQDELSIHIPKSAVIMIGAIIVLTIGTIWSFQSAKNRTPTVVLPGGITYLGPSPTAIPTAAVQNWATQKGLIYPYSFSYPKSLSLGVFPGDPFDSITIFTDNTNPQENLLLRVEKKEGSTRTYAQEWWKQYSAWKGAQSVTEFKNSQGLVGWRARYLDGNNSVPYEHVFFEIPGKPDIVIWMSAKLLDTQTFNTIVDSVSWQN